MDAKKQPGRVMGFFTSPPASLPSDQQPLFVAGMIGSVGTFLAHGAMIIYYLWVGVPQMVSYHYLALPLLFFMILLMRSGRLAAAYGGIALEFFAHAWLATYYLGLASNLHTPYIGAIIGVACMPLKNRRAVWLIEIPVVLGYGALLLLFFDASPVQTPSPERLAPVAIGMPFFTLSLTALFMLFLLRSNQRLFRLVENEQEKTEKLLLNVLPKSIADRLKSDAHTIADRFDGASVLFADIVDFTVMASTLSPSAVVTVLDEVFCVFDQIAEDEGLEKIKTIGDAYMAAAGVPEACPDHALRAARMAVRMTAAMAEYRQNSGHEVHCRVGICSGPVVAGVIGRRRFLYDLWGDTVNTASRMESHGIADRIQVTESTYSEIKHDFSFSFRGEIEIKGKGPMKTWFLEHKQK